MIGWVGIMGALSSSSAVHSFFDHCFAASELLLSLISDRVSYRYFLAVIIRINSPDHIPSTKPMYISSKWVQSDFKKVLDLFLIFFNNVHCRLK